MMFVVLIVWISALLWLLEIMISGVGSVMFELDFLVIIFVVVVVFEIFGVLLFFVVWLFVFEFVIGGLLKWD